MQRGEGIRQTATACSKQYKIFSLISLYLNYFALLFRNSICQTLIKMQLQHFVRELNKKKRQRKVWGFFAYNTCFKVVLLKFSCLFYPQQPAWWGPTERHMQGGQIVPMDLPGSTSCSRRKLTANWVLTLPICCGPRRSQQIPALRHGEHEMKLFQTTHIALYCFISVSSLSTKII